MPEVSFSPKQQITAGFQAGQNMAKGLEDYPKQQTTAGFQIGRNMAKGLEDYPKQQTTAGFQIGRNIAKGLGVQLLPIYSEYKVGQSVTDLKNATKALDSFTKGKAMPVMKEKGGISKFMTGLATKLLFFVPVVNSYMVGKSKNELTNGQKTVEAVKNGEVPPEQKKAGFLKTFGTGLIESIKLCIPFYGTYYTGKQVNEINNLAKDVQVIYAEY